MLQTHVGLLWPACDMEWNWLSDSLERSGHQQRLLQAFIEDVFIFSLLMYIAH